MSTNVTVDLMQILYSNVMSHVQPYTLQLNQSQRTNTTQQLSKHVPETTLPKDDHQKMGQNMLV